MSHVVQVDEIVPLKNEEKQPDNFDWFGDDDERPEDILDAKQKEKEAISWSVYMPIVGWIALMLSALAFIPAIIEDGFGRKLPSFKDTSASTFSYFIAFILMSLTLSQLIVYGMGRLLRLSQRLSKSSFFSYYDSVSISLQLSLSSLFTMMLYFVLFNKPCNIENPSAQCDLLFIRNIIFCFVATSFALLAQRILIQLISNNFHKRAFSHRITEIRFKNYIVSELIRAGKPADTTEHIHPPGFFCFACSRDTLPLLANSASFTLKRFKSSFGEMPSSLKNLQFEEWELQSEYDARKAARDIFYNIRSPGQDQLTEDNFRAVFGGAEATKDAFHLFDIDYDNAVSKREFRSIMVNIFKERVNLLASMKNVRGALQKLDGILRIITVFLVVFLYLAIFNFYAQDLIALAISFTLAFNVVFRNLSTDLLNCILFIFNEHAFDVGDNVTIDGNNYVVFEIQLLHTIFHTWNGSEVYISNTKLYQSVITNHQRATEQWEKIDFEINLSTSDHQLSDLRARVSEFLKSHSQFFYSQFLMTPKDSPSFDKLYFTIKVKCKPTTDNRKKWDRHGKLLHFLKELVDTLGIVYYNAK